MQCRYVPNAKLRNLQELDIQATPLDYTIFASPNSTEVNYWCVCLRLPSCLSSLGVSEGGCGLHSSAVALAKDTCVCRRKATATFLGAMNTKGLLLEVPQCAFHLCQMAEVQSNSKWFSDMQTLICSRPGFPLDSQDIHTTVIPE